ncbi:iron uptake system component EfeO [Nocardioides albertanoniae]|uniref:Iron uptake system component EfeO n=1 Tax=Nocardioides albertanoniae TaxID=1175486 RepID=A0A543AA78_9ACTN|nr:iron uptake system protein EfeO [Nocardioides albertanoniae]TQL69508.1 iron uptake system component EfeO [Nocardioides albertanoniae]
MSRKAISLAALAALCVTGLAACGGENDDSKATKKGGATQVAVSMVSGSDGDACELDTDSVAAGPVTFTVKNESAAGLTEVELMDGQKILGEKENLAPGLAEATFTLTLGGGDYEIYCPGATQERVPFKVTGEAAAEPTGDAAELLASGSKDYTTYVRTQIDSMVVGVENLQKAVDSGDLAKAQQAYADARPFYEKIESDVEGFVMDGFDPTDNKGNLDYLIDMRASNLDEAVGWSGFHAVERDLFQAKKITAQTKKYAADLVTNVTKLAEVGKSLEFKPEDLANGAAALLEEVQSGKITGEEEAYSHIDLVDFANNVEGAQQAYAALRPGLEKVDAELVKTIDARFTAVTDDLEGYKDTKSLGGYRPYTAELKASDGKKLSATVQSLQDVLGRLAEKAATA